MAPVAEQREAQTVLVVKFFLLGDLVRADTDNRNTSSLQFGQCVPHRLGLGRSAGCIGFWVEKEKQPLPLEVGQADGIAILILCCENRCRISCL